MGRSHFDPADGPLMLRRVLEDPADDQPRLSYSDWLEERAEPGDRERAEFIRLQIELDNLKIRSLISLLAYQRNGDVISEDRVSGQANLLCDHAFVGDLVDWEAAYYEREKSMWRGVGVVVGADSRLMGGRWLSIKPIDQRTAPRHDAERQRRGQIIDRINELWGQYSDKNGVRLEIRESLKGIVSDNAFVLPSHLSGSDCMVVVHRGFVRSIKLTCDQFFGKTCISCRGSGLRLLNVERTNAFCEYCNGHKRGKGAVRSIFSEHPITRVVLLDSVIHSSRGNDSYYMGGLDIFPSKYWSRLENHKSGADINNAISQVCVEWGRELAGLPPLPTK